MAEFSKLVITEKGNELIAKALANTATIKFTKVSSSAKAYEFSELETLEALTDIKQTLFDPSVKRVNATSVEIKAAFNNMELTEGYYLRTFGLYAEDSDSEILYGVTSEISGNCYIPAYNGVTSSGMYLKFVTKAGNSQNVSLEINPAAVATIGDLEGLKETLEIIDFDDSGEVESIESFADFMSSFVKNTSIYQLFANLKAGLKYVLHTGKLVNNGLTETPGEFALDAAYGKTLTDQITGLYSDITAPDDVSFIFDYQDGKYGYNTDPERGADTFRPFSEIDKTKLIAALASSGMGLTMESTAEQIYAALKAKFPDDIVIFDNGIYDSNYIAPYLGIKTALGYSNIYQTYYNTPSGTNFPMFNLKKSAKKIEITVAATQSSSGSSTWLPKINSISGEALVVPPANTYKKIIINSPAAGTLYMFLQSGYSMDVEVYISKVVITPYAS